MAHRLAGTMLRLLEANSDIVDPAEYHLRIARLYTKLMPSAYVDSAHEAIAMLVFQNQISRMYDSLAGDIGDSLLHEMVSCQRATMYTVPVTFNGRVLQALSFFAQARKGMVQRWLQRGARYLPSVQQLLADSGLPADLAYLPLIESGYNPRAYSYAHASGIWQFIPSTGEKFGLRRSYWLDERRDPLRSTMAAISYLRALYAEFGDWHVALASYNCGENGMRRTIERSGTADYWSLTLPKQTMEYVPKYIAALVVARNPECFGVAFGDSAIPGVDTVHVSRCIEMAKLAEALDTSVDTLEALNPHMLRWCTPPDIDDVVLYLPSGKADAYRRFAAKLKPEDEVKWVRYRIRPGDNLISIAKRFGTSVPAIRSVNKLSGHRIIAGKTLFIPLAAGANAEAAEAAARERVSSTAATGTPVRYLVKSGETMSRIAELFNTSVERICRWNRMSDPDALRAGTILLLHPRQEPASAEVDTRRSAGSGKRRTYTVRTGDNLSAIARGLEVNLVDLLAWNGKERNNPLIRPGEELVYYSSGSPPPTTAGSRSEGDTLTYEVQAGDNLTRIADLFSVSTEVLASLNGLTRSSVIHPGDLLRVPAGRRSGNATSRERLIYYEVKKGDTLWSISRLFDMPLRDLYSLNGLGESSRLMPGDTLKVMLAEGQ